MKVQDWCDRREYLGDCHEVDPEMCATLVDIIELRKSLKDATSAKNKMIQEGEGLKERCAAAVKAMKHRQYTLCIQVCPERNPEDTDQYNDAVSNIDEWEREKLKAHQNRLRELEEGELSMETKYNQMMYKTGMNSYKNMNMHAQPPIEVADTLDAGLMHELESVLQSTPLDKADRALLAQLFEDYLSSGENWMQSSVVINATRKSTQRRRGKFKMVEYKMLKQTYGQAIAKQLRDSKKELQASNPSDGITYWMEHPDLPGREDRSDTLKNGFVAELEARSNSIQKVKSDMEELYGKQISEEDLKNDPSKRTAVDNLLNACDAVMTSYTGTLRGIKLAVETWRPGRSRSISLAELRSRYLAIRQRLSGLRRFSQLGA
eukprot:s3370_g4.t1